MKAPLALQYALPHRLLSRLVMWATRWRLKPFKNFLIRRIVAAYGVDLDEAVSADPASYPHFNAFFTRALKPGARPVDEDPAALVMPADGRVSQLGRITGQRIFQAKGRDYEIAALLADPAAADTFADGLFATVYLSPRDYHRVHMPWTGRLLETVHVPGRLFSVAPHAVAGIPGLFARNERLVCRFECDFGPMAVVMVGAMLVSGVESVWRGVEVPPYARRIVRRDYRDREVLLEKGAEMARFNMGSTVVVLLPDCGFELEPGLGPEDPVRLGRRLATRRA